MAGFSMRGGEEDEAPIAEINVTPFVDVMLVLLVIVMVAAPLATAEVPVHLPPAGASATPPPAHPAQLTLRADGALLLDTAVLTPALSGPALLVALGGDRARPIALRADSGLSYGAVMAVLDRLRGAGFERVGLVGLETDAPK